MKLVGDRPVGAPRDRSEGSSAASSELSAASKEPDAALPRGRDDSTTTSGCRLVSIQTFTALACGVALLHTVAFTIQASTLTTLQKSFGLSTFDAAIAYGAYMVGEILSGILVSYFGGQRRKPRIVSIAMVLTAATCFAHASPHFLFDSALSVSSVGPGSVNRMGAECSAHPSTLTLDRDDASRLLLNHTNTDCTVASDKRAAVLSIYIAASTVMGLGYGPMPILLMLYIDDNAGSRGKASFYQSVFYALYQLSPAVGYSIAAASLSTYTDFTDVPFSAEDSRWIGAWWLGYLCCGLAILLLAVPLFFFPERLSRDCLADQDQKQDESLESLKACKGDGIDDELADYEAPLKILGCESSAVSHHGGGPSELGLLACSCHSGTSVLANRQPSCCCLQCAALSTAPATSTAAAAVATAGTAPESEGFLGSPAAAGCMPDDRKSSDKSAGGRDLEAKESRHPTAKMFLPTLWQFMKNPIYMLSMLILCTVSWIEAGFFSFLPKYLEVQFHQSASAADMEAGVSGSIMSAVAVMAGGWVINKFKLTLKQCTIILVLSFLLSLTFYFAASFCTCPQYIASEMSYNNSYNCSNAEYRPVCLDGTTYFSPCHAGCQNSSTDAHRRMTYSGCLCSDKEAVDGICTDETCKSLIPFMILVILADFCGAFSSMARVTLLLRCVEREHRSFSFGLASELSNFIGWFSAPLLYGMLIDESCLTWDRGSAACASAGGGSRTGSCLQYDNAAFAGRVTQLTYASSAIGLVLASGTWLLVHFSKRSTSMELHSLSEKDCGDVDGACQEEATA